MTENSLEVDPKALEQAEDGAYTVANRLTQHTDDFGDTTLKALAVHAGWESYAALHACLDAWEKRLNELRDEVTKLGTNLEATVQEYRKAERRIEEAIQNVRELIRALGGD